MQVSPYVNICMSIQNSHKVASKVLYVPVIVREMVHSTPNYLRNNFVLPTEDQVISSSLRGAKRPSWTLGGDWPLS